MSYLPTKQPDLSEVDGCEHSSKEWAVRVSCHDDLMSDECAKGAQRSEWCCGRPSCKARCMQLVKAATGFEPVLAKKGQQ